MRRFAWLSFRRSLLRDHRLVASLLATVGGLVCAAGILVASSAAATYESLSTESALTLIEVNANSASGRVALDQAFINKAQAIGHVTTVYPWAQAGLSFNTGSLAGVVWATSTAPALMPKCLAGTCQVTSDGQIVLPSTIMGHDLTATLGTTIQASYQVFTGKQETPGNTNLQYDDKSVTLKVVGLYDPNDAVLDGLTAAFVTQHDAVTWEAAGNGMTTQQFLANGFDTVFINVDQTDNVPSVKQALAGLGIPTVSFYTLAEQLPQALAMVNLLSAVAAIALLIVCAMVGWSIGSAVALSRRHLVGLFKALGWTSRSIVASFLGELALFGLVIGVAGAIVTLLAAVITTWAAGGNMWAGMLVPSHLYWSSIWWLAAEIAGPVIAIAMGGLPRLIATSHLPPDDALREL